VWLVGYAAAAAAVVVVVAVVAVVASALAKDKRDCSVTGSHSTKSTVVAEDVGLVVTGLRTVLDMDRPWDYSL
jgi:hypothetical protein